MVNPRLGQHRPLVVILLVLVCCLQTRRCAGVSSSSSLLQKIKILGVPRNTKLVQQGPFVGEERISGKNRGRVRQQEQQTTDDGDAVVCDLDALYDAEMACSEENNCESRCDEAYPYDDDVDLEGGVEALCRTVKPYLCALDDCCPECKQEVRTSARCIIANIQDLSSIFGDLVDDNNNGADADDTAADTEDAFVSLNDDDLPELVRPGYDADFECDLEGDVCDAEDNNNDSNGKDTSGNETTEEEDEDESAAINVPSSSMLDVALGSAAISNFANILVTAGLGDTLSGEGPFTVFAPSNDAFSALGSLTIDRLLADVDLLAEMLLYHVVEGEFESYDLEDNMLLQTLNGESVTILSDPYVMINDANVVVLDIQATNGVLHVIDRVLIPSAVEYLAAQTEEEDEVLLPPSIEDVALPSVEEASATNFGDGGCSGCSDPGYFCGIDGACHPFSCQNYYQYSDRKLTGYADNSTLQCFGYQRGDEENSHGVIYGCNPLYPFTIMTPGKQVTKSFNRKCTATREGGYSFECYEFSPSEMATDFTGFEQEAGSAFPDCGDKLPKFYYMIASSNHYVGFEGLQGNPIVSGGSDNDGDTIWQTNEGAIFQRENAMTAMYANVVGGASPPRDTTPIQVGSIGGNNPLTNPRPDQEEGNNTLTGGSGGDLVASSNNSTVRVVLIDSSFLITSPSNKTAAQMKASGDNATLELLVEAYRGMVEQVVITLLEAESAEAIMEAVSRSHGHQRHLVTGVDSTSAEIYDFQDCTSETEVTRQSATTNCMTVFGKYQVMAAEEEDVQEVYGRYKNATAESIISGGLQSSLDKAATESNQTAGFTIEGISPVVDESFDPFVELENGAVTAADAVEPKETRSPTMAPTSSIPPSKPIEIIPDAESQSDAGRRCGCQLLSSRSLFVGLTAALLFVW